MGGDGLARFVGVGAAIAAFVFGAYFVAGKAGLIDAAAGAHTLRAEIERLTNAPLDSAAQ